MKKSILLIALPAITSISGATPVDQSQPAYTRTDDLNSGDKSGQTFVAGQTRLLLGLRLVAEGGKWRGDYPAGSDFRVRLRSVGANGVPLEPVLASGVVSKSLVQTNISSWVEMRFDDAYYQTAGERLCFMIEELSGGGSNGWNNYGNSVSNLYLNGVWFYSTTFSEGSLPPTDKDFAFETLVLPASEMSFDIDPDGSLNIGTGESYTDIVYYLEYRTNLIEGTWQEYSVTTGVTSLEWMLKQPPNKCLYYRLRAHD